MAFKPAPQVPYNQPINGISTGVLISFAGQPLPDAKWFAINLQTGPRTDPRDDLALHISPRFDGPASKVIRNSLQNQQWGIEENFGHFPFQAGMSFEILIMVDQDCFKIAINGEHFTEFRHRLPPQAVQTLTIDGDVRLYHVRHEGGAAGFPDNAMSMPAPSVSPMQMQQQGMPPPPYQQQQQIGMVYGQPEPYETQQQAYGANQGQYSNQPQYGQQTQAAGQGGYPQLETNQHVQNEQGMGMNLLKGAAVGGIAAAAGGYVMKKMGYPKGHGVDNLKGGNGKTPSGSADYYGTGDKKKDKKHGKLGKYGLPVAGGLVGAAGLAGAAYIGGKKLKKMGKHKKGKKGYKGHGSGSSGSSSSSSSSSGSSSD